MQKINPIECNTVECNTVAGNSIAGSIDAIKDRIDLSRFDIAFRKKPCLMGGLVMEYFGLRKSAHDIDFIIADEDYQALAEKYPDCKKDKWGDLGVMIGEYELFRSIMRLDYDFLSEGAVEQDTFKVMSLDRLIFMKAMAYENQPEIQKHSEDFKLILHYVYDTYRNDAYAGNMEKHIQSYLSAPDGTIYQGHYNDE